LNSDEVRLISDRQSALEFFNRIFHMAIAISLGTFIVHLVFRTVSENTEKTSLFKMLIQNYQSLWVYTFKNLISIDTYSV